MSEAEAKSQEIPGYREAYRRAVASVRMESGILSPLFFEGMERIIKGEITADEEIANLATYYKSKENA